MKNIYRQPSEVVEGTWWLLLTTNMCPALIKILFSWNWMKSWQRRRQESRWRLFISSSKFESGDSLIYAATPNQPTSAENLGWICHISLGLRRFSFPPTHQFCWPLPPCRLGNAHKVTLMGTEPLILALLEASFSSNHRPAFNLWKFPQNFQASRLSDSIREKQDKCVFPLLMTRDKFNSNSIQIICLLIAASSSLYDFEYLWKQQN